MADSTAYTSEKLALILSMVDDEVTSSLTECNPLFDIVQRWENTVSDGPFYRLPSSSQMRLSTTGGIEFTFPVRVDALGVTTRMTTESQNLAPTQKNQDLRCVYDVVTVATPLAIFDLRLNMASGKEAVVDYVTEQTIAAKEDHINELSGANYLWSSTSAGGITGLNHAINTTTGSGVFGGLDRALHTNWTNSTVTTSTYAVSKEGIRELTQMMATIAGKGGKVGMHVTDAAAFAMFAATQYGQLQVGSVNKDPFAGIPVVMGAPVLIDPNLTDDYWYGIDLRYMKWYVMPYKRLGNKPAFALSTPMKELEKQLGTSFAVVTQGNLCFTKLNTHFVQVISAWSA